MAASAIEPTVWKIAVCLFDDVTALDFQGPVELLGFLSPASLARRKLIESNIAFDLHYLADSLQTVSSASGPALQPTGTYTASAGTQYDILLIPGGANARPEQVPPRLLEFIKQQAVEAKYILTVCTGSWVLAGTGLLDGKRATTNKSSFLRCKEATSNKIEWVAKARWVVDGNIWTSSGVTAGMDMANAFLVHMIGDEAARKVRGIVELSARNQDDDEFAEYYGLV